MLGNVYCQSEVIPLLEGAAVSFLNLFLAVLSGLLLLLPALYLSPGRALPEHCLRPRHLLLGRLRTLPDVPADGGSYCLGVSLTWALPTCLASSHSLQRPFFSMQYLDFYFGVVSCCRPKQRCQNFVAFRGSTLAKLPFLSAE